MGCNCGGSRSQHAFKAKTLAARKSSPGEKWRVKFANGTSKTFEEEWMAHHAVSILGGEIVRVTSKEDPPAQ